MSASPATPTRREQQRRQTEAELRDATLAEIREHGAVAVTLRGVARRVGMSPAGMYRYVDSRDGLLTMVIADRYHAYADHLEAALATAPDDVEERLRTVALAYRTWAVEHGNAFGLLFGDPIPDYQAPADGPTTDGMRRLGQALADPLIAAYNLGCLRVPEALDVPELVGPLQAMAELGGDLPPAVYALLLLTWGRLHGQVSLEVFGHHAWLFPEGCEPLYRAEVETLLSQLLAR